jgi:predicted GNAT family acetyltransferase
MTTSGVIDNRASGRFELPLGDGMAHVDYRTENGRLVLAHTEVPQAYAGQGIGSRLARGALEHARARGVPVEIRCPFLQAYVARHPEFADLTGG